ncbi:POK9 protein, partial [Chloroceryle aenea]|nr:POK9 protein [Chloroceryle aenea]
GSLGLDVATAIDIMLTNDKVELIPSDIDGPLSSNKNIGALLIGTSSASVKGIFVIPGVIDADYEGNIKIMAHAQLTPIWVPKGTKIAQLVAIPIGWSHRNSKPRTGGFGSKGDVVCLTLPLKNKPVIQMTLKKGIDERRVAMLADTRADVTVI